MTTIIIEGKQYVLVPAEQYDRMLGSAGSLPALPKKNRSGRRPAVATAQVMIARTIVRRRHAADMTQVELARRAGIRVETICRLEAGKHRPQRATIDLIDRVLTEAGA